MSRPIARLAGVVVAAAALHAATPQTVHAQLGVVAGANFSTLADLQNGAALTEFSASSGYHVGVFAELGGAVSLRPALLYLNSGALFSGSSLLTVSTFDMSYLAIPVDLKINVVPLLYVFGGPEFQVLLSSDAQPDFQDDLESLVAHGAAGLGLQLGPVHLEGRYLFGLSGVTSDTYTVGAVSVTGGDQVSNAVRLSVGIGF